MRTEPPFNVERSNESIRQRLEQDAWARHPDLARRLRQRRDDRPGTRRLRWQDRVLLLTGIVLMLALLVRIETATAQTAEDAFGLQLLTDGGVTTELALDTAMHVEVTGLLARVLVVQEFRNDGGGWAEGIYRFPLPDGAAVDRLFIRVGERVLEGEIREREAATRVYRQARAAGQTASLVSQERPNQFETRLANIGPGEDIQVMIGFLVAVDYSDGMFSLRLPTTFNRRFGVEPQPGLGGAAPRPLLTHAGASPGHRLSIDIDLLTGIDFAAIRSRYHDVDIQPLPDGYRVSLAGNSARSDRDFELAWYPDLHATPQSSLLTWDAGDAVYAQLMLMPPRDEALAPQPREVIFVIDTSGSMEGASLNQARSALLRGLDELGAGDRFNLLEFNSVTTLLFTDSVPATAGNLQRAREAVHRLRANGGTVMAPALDAALAPPLVTGLMRQVVFVTDGSVGNERELLGRIADGLGDARLFTVSIGSAPNSWFMRKAAEIGRGSHTHIGRIDEVAERMTALWTRIRLPAIADICIDWGIEAEYYPEVIPDLYAGSSLWLIARLPAEPGPVTLCGELNGEPWDFELSQRPGRGGEILSTLWARRKVEALQDSLVFGADPERMQGEVTRVALDFGLLTPHTSLVAVDRTPARLPGEALATGQIPSLLPAGSSAEVTGFPPTATGWRTQLLLSLLVLLISGWMFFLPGARLPVHPSRSLANRSDRS